MRDMSEIRMEFGFEVKKLGKSRLKAIISRPFFLLKKIESNQWISKQC